MNSRRGKTMTAFLGIKDLLQSKFEAGNRRGGVEGEQGSGLNLCT